MESNEATQAHGFFQFRPAEEILQKYGLPNSRQMRTKVVQVRSYVEEIPLLIRLEDPSNNRGRGWVRISEQQLADLLYIAIKVAKRSRLRLLVDRNSVRADEAAKELASLLSVRLRNYPMFGPARAGDVHSCGPDGINGKSGPELESDPPEFIQPE